ncbi:hypothetical protein ACFFHH_08685 [Cytobacillus solani]|nr:hypothetical protein [Cytobacillus solani]USK53598.1 hypothetical protein LIS82_18585 [Cytobacillus solani]
MLVGGEHKGKLLRAIFAGTIGTLIVPKALALFKVAIKYGSFFFHL